MHTIDFLTTFVKNHEFLAYAVVFIGVLFEGELTLILSGVLAHVGVISAALTLFFAFLGAMGKTFAGYYFGIFIKKYIPPNRLFSYVEHRVLYFLPRFKEKPFWSILISKFIYGVNHLVIIFAGYLRANFKTFIEAELLSTVPWVSVMFSLGYFFSSIAFSVGRDFRKSAFIIILFIVGFAVLQHIINVAIEISEESKAENT